MGMNRTLPLQAAVALAAVTPSAAAQIGTKQTTATDEAKSIVTEPLEDANIRQRKIPETLVRIAGQPYSLSGLRTCAQLSAAVTELDGVLGPDVDAPPAKKGDVRTAVGVAGSLVGSIIPGRGLVREISGANKVQREYEQAIYAGLARRAFLKGVGAQRGCKPPAAPAKSQ